MNKFFFLCFLLFFPWAFGEEQDPSFESLSNASSHSAISLASTRSRSAAFLEVSQKHLELQKFLDALPLFLNPAFAQALPSAKAEFQKILSEKTTAMVSSLQGIEDQDFVALKESLLKLGSEATNPRDIPGILFQIDAHLLKLGQILLQNAAYQTEVALPENQLEAAYLLIQQLKTRDFSSNPSGLQNLLKDLGQVLELENDPTYEVFEKVSDNKSLSLVLPELGNFFQAVLLRKDGRDPWHPQVYVNEGLSPTQKDQIIASALNSSSNPSPGFFRRTQSAISNFLIPQAHASTTPVMATAQALALNPQSPTSSNAPRRRVVKLPNGSEYRGDLVGNLPQGRGWLKNTNGTSYVGDWVLGKPQGHGVLRFQKGNTYQGEIHNGIPQGKGSFTAPDGTVYQGMVHNGRPHGEGKILFPNGIVIEAEFKNGIPDGISLLRDGFGNTSEFSFVDGEPLGDARIFSQGLILDGFFKNSFDAFDLVSITDRFGNFAEIFSEDTSESVTDSSLPSGPLVEIQKQQIEVYQFVAYESGFRCSWDGEVSPFGSARKLYPHGYGKLSCEDGFLYTGQAESYLHPTNGVKSEAHGYGRVTLSTKRKEAITEIDGNFERGKVIGQARVLFDSGLVFEGRVDTTRVTLNPTVKEYRSPAAKDGIYSGSEDHPLGINGVLYLGPVQNSYPHGYGVFKRYWYRDSLAHTERCQYQSLPVFPEGGSGYRRAGYCEYLKPDQEEFKGYQYGNSYTVNPTHSYPGPLGRGADYKNGQKWREGWYADGAHYIGEEIPANYPQDHAFVPAGKFTNTAITLWDTYRLLEELKQANGLADEEVIRARLIDALKQAVIGKALQKVADGIIPVAQKLLRTKKPSKASSPSQAPRSRDKIKKDQEFAASQTVLQGGVGYHSYGAFKRAQGPAGEGKQWHHIVEQRLEDKFGPEAIHNTKNVVAVPVEVHREISAHYSSTGEGIGKTNREIVGTMSYTDQFNYGKDKMEEISKRLANETGR